MYYIYGFTVEPFLKGPVNYYKDMIITILSDYIIMTMSRSFTVICGHLKCESIIVSHVLIRDTTIWNK